MTKLHFSWTPEAEPPPARRKSLRDRPNKNDTPTPLCKMQGAARAERKRGFFHEKAMKKLMAALLAVAMVCAMAIPAFCGWWYYYW